MSIESTQKVIEAYFAADHGDTSMLADDIVFTDMASGNESHGPEKVLGMLNWFYHVAFEATPETSQMIFSDGHAVWEGFVSGKHVGEFAGIAATGGSTNGLVHISAVAGRLGSAPLTPVLGADTIVVCSCILSSTS